VIKYYYYYIAAGRDEADSQINEDRHVYDKTKSPSIQVMMDLLKHGPFIAGWFYKHFAFLIKKLTLFSKS
jgi:hypothetical protein